MSHPICRSFRAFIILTVVSSFPAIAADKTFPIQARLFIANTTVNPGELNQAMTAESLKTFDKTSQLGVEITYPVIRFLDVGMRYTRRNTMQDEATTTTSTNYHGTIAQDSILLLARVPVMRASVLKFDVFAGVGGSNTTFEMQTAAQNGTLSKKATSEWFASPHWSYGASGGLGFKRFFIYLEGGYERNRITGLTRTGTLPAGINTLELSGRYVMIGLLFDGISGYKK